MVEDSLTEQSCYTTPHTFLSTTSAPPGDWQTLADLASQERATLLDIFENSGVVTGVFAPSCGTHTGLTNENFTQQIVEDFDEDTGTFSGVGRTLRAALGAWLLAGTPVRVIDAAPSDGVAPSSQCLGVTG